MSSELEFFPYAFSGDVLELRCEPTDARFEACEGGERLDLTEWHGDGHVSLNLEVVFDPKAVAQLVPESERPSPPLRVVVRAKSIEGRYRAVVLDDTPASSPVTGVVTLDYDEARGSLTLEPVLVRASAAPNATAGFAAHAAGLVGRGEPIVVDIDRGPASLGRTLDVRYTAFSVRAVEDELFEVNDKRPFLVDMRGENPVVYLNEEIESLRQIMDSKAKTGSARRIRDIMFTSVVTQGWTALGMAAMAALTGVLNVDSSLAGHEAVPQLNEWQQSALAFLVPRMYGLGTEEALDRLAGDLRSSSSAGLVATRLSTAVQNQAALIDAYRGLLKLRDGGA